MKLVPTEEYFENAEQLLAEGKNVELRVTGGSMRPYMRGDGSETIIVSPSTDKELVRGAFVVFRYHGKLICHRIVNRNGDRLTIQGDGIVKSQEHIQTSDVLGVVRTVVRRNGKAYETQSPSARRYWRLWLRLLPVRKWLLLPFRVLGKIRRESAKRLEAK